MEYNIRSHKTTYAGVLLRSRLEARWAAFFDLIEWKWKYEPYDLRGWTPDFLVEFPCGHSECPPTHKLLIEIKPYESIKQFSGHPCKQYHYGQDDNGNRIPADASAGFGNDPSVSEWEMSHGGGGGTHSLPDFSGNRTIDEVEMMRLWNRAGNIVRYIAKSGATP